MLARVVLLVTALTLVSVNANPSKADNIDSLQNVLVNTIQDTSKINLLFAIAEEVYLWNLDSALVIIQEVIYVADNSLQDSVDLPERHKLTLLTDLASGLNNIGYIYKFKGDISNALESYFSSLKISDKINDQVAVGNLYNNIGMIYDGQDDKEKALRYYQDGLQVLEQAGSMRHVAFVLENIGILHDNNGDLEKGFECYGKALKIRQDLKDNRGIALSYNNIAYYYHKTGKMEEALDTSMKALELFKEINDKRGIVGTLTSIGWIYLDMGEYDKAHLSLSQSLEKARTLGYPAYIKRVAKLLSQLYKEQGKYEKALVMYEEHITMRDSIVNQKNEKTAIRQEMKYEFEKAQIVKEQNEKETMRVGMEAQQRRDNLQYSVILIAILTLFGGVLMLGFVNVGPRMAEGIIFFSFLILFEFFLVLADPYIDKWSGGAPGFKLLFNAGIAALIFPLHAFFETKLKRRISE
ncbi:MAG: hypothetical protein COB85_09875 [Bacteroidetes bacterium]|nr:MAG: hypothetical protein COB85_09875 [Bacteroidota bacterium]